MKILNLTYKSKVYTSNVYLITGSHNAIDDVNTLIDVGRDPSIIDKINNASTGVGKKRVVQVVLTHNHYDHTSLLPEIREIFKPEVYAFSRFLKGMDHLVKDGDMLRLGDRMFEIIHIPGHSDDSICLYCEEDRVLFVGDTQIIIESAGSTYEKGFIFAMEKLCRKNIKTIYFGHGDPLSRNCNKQIRASLRRVRESITTSPHYHYETCK